MERYIVLDIAAFKRLAKILSRSLGVRHSTGLEQLSVASGYPNWHALHTEYQRMEPGAPIRRSAVDPRVWMDQVVEVFGPNARNTALVKEVLVWYQHTFGAAAPAEMRSVDIEVATLEAKASSLGHGGVPTVVVTYKKRRRLEER